MARPSIKAQRLEQILQAMQRCIARYGIEGSTLERIAEEAGLKRSLVRHFAGNREELIDQLADKVITQSSRDWSDFLIQLADGNSSQSLLSALFSDEYSDPEYVLALESLIFAAGHDASLQAKMQHWFSHFNSELYAFLKRCHPNASDCDLNTVTFGIISLYFNLDSLSPLNVCADYRQSALRGAQHLLHLLDH